MNPECRALFPADLAFLLPHGYQNGSPGYRE
jgi:hypothetical protein